MLTETRCGIICALLWCAFALPASADDGISERTLSGGLKVIVKRDRRSPVVVSQIWYRAGSVDEQNGSTGVAHLLEHMMFKGTRNFKEGEFSRLIAEAGGNENAFTSRDYTAYFEELQNARLALAFKLEADRMANLSILPEEFAKEIKVVMEERRLRTDDQPRALLEETLNAAAFEEHPYHWPVIGWMNDLESMTAADARNWYQRWYAPNNAILVVVGDVAADDVFALAEKYFGRVPARQLPARKPQDERPQHGIRRVELKAPAELPFLTMAWKAPAIRDVENDWEPYALQVLGGVLDGNESARLTQSLVRESQVASEIGTAYEPAARGPALFLIDGAPSEGKSVKELEAAIRVELEKIARDGVTEEELKRVKAQVVAGQVYNRDSVFEQAQQIGATEAIGYSFRDIDRMLQKIKAVTAEQVQAVAKKYFIDDALTIAVLDPQPVQGKRPAPAAPGIGHGFETH